MNQNQLVKSGRGAKALAMAVAVLLAGPGLSLGAVGSFAAKDFLSASGDWDVPANWSHTYNEGTSYFPGSILEYYNDARIGGDRVVTVGTDLSAYSSQLRQIIVGNNSDGYLNVSSGAHLAAYSVTSVGVGGGAGYVDIEGTLSSSSISMGAGEFNVTPGSTVNLTSQHQFNINGGTVNFTGGSITDISGNNSGGWQIRGGEVNHSGGTSTMKRELQIGRGSVPAVYNLSGAGVINARSVVLGNAEGTSGDGTLNVSGGTLNTGGTLFILSSSSDSTSRGQLVVSGGAVNVNNDTRVGNFAETGLGTFSVIGNQGSITLGNIVNSGTNGPVEANNNAPLIVWENGTLNFVVGSAGISPINIVSSSPGDSRSVSFLMGTLDMGLASGYAPELNQTFDLVTTNVTGSYLGTVGLDITGLALAAGDETDWTFGVVSSEGITKLQATYIGEAIPVPEPASLTLFGLTGLALLRRRQR